MSQVSQFLNRCPKSPTGTHQFATYPDHRVCRVCGHRESRGSDECFNGHNWSVHVDGRYCRRCRLQVRNADVEAWERGSR